MKFYILRPADLKIKLKKNNKTYLMLSSVCTNTSIAVTAVRFFPKHIVHGNKMFLWQEVK